MPSESSRSGLIRPNTSRKLKKLRGGEALDETVSTAINDLEGWKSIYRQCIDLRNFEISQLVQRNNFFMIFQGVLLAGVVQSGGSMPVVSFLVCLAGLGVSILQTYMASGAKYWQEHWEINTQISEQRMTELMKLHRILYGLVKKQNLEVTGDLLSKIESRRLVVHLFSPDSNKERIRDSLKDSRRHGVLLNWMIMQRFSISRVPIYVGILLTSVWLLLLLCTVHIEGWSIGIPSNIIGFPRTPG